MQLNETSLIYEYSEDKKGLKKLMQEIKVFISEPTFKPYFIDDKESRNVYRVTIKRGENKISFTFGDSITNTNKNEKPRLYDILACLNSDFHTPETFKDFCNEYGYNKDSIKANKLFKLCSKQSQKLKKIFTEDEINTLPR